MKNLIKALPHCTINPKLREPESVELKKAKVMVTPRIIIQEEEEDKLGVQSGP